MTTIHTLTRIVATEATDLCFIWSDGYSEQHAPDWTGWTRGVVGGTDYERYDGSDPFNDSDVVAEVFVAKGGVVEAYVPPVEDPAPLDDLAPWQFFSMLDLSGQRGALDAFIAALPEPDRTVASNKLDRSLSFQRQNDLVLVAQQALGLTDEQLDALWLQASKL